jgi:hypothetical protein
MMSHPVAKFSILTLLFVTSLNALLVHFYSENIITAQHSIVLKFKSQFRDRVSLPYWSNGFLYEFTSISMLDDLASVELHSPRGLEKTYLMSELCREASPPTVRLSQSSGNENVISYKLP